MLILASTSVYRRALLERLGLPFQAESPGVDEHPLPGELPPDRALRLATAKADAVAARFPGAVVIGSDQVAAVGDRMLDKPGNEANCRDQLTLMSGKTALFHTACTIADPSAGLRATHIDTTKVVFRTLRPEEIARYVLKEQPFDCAGGFKVEGLGISLFERVESTDPTALIGLPLIWVAAALRGSGHWLP